MRCIGFSTGALALSDFRRGLRLLRDKGVCAVELSALRENEVDDLLEGIAQAGQLPFSYVSVHAPSGYLPENEQSLANKLGRVAERGWAIILHPDAISRMECWRRFGELLCIENMDKRKPRGRTAQELQTIFEALPEASFCFDIGHARQVDPTMSEAASILKAHGHRLRQLHMSDVNSQNRHDPLTYGAVRAFRKVAGLIPRDIAVILESRIGDENSILSEIDKAKRALEPAHKSQENNDSSGGFVRAAPCD